MVALSVGGSLVSAAPDDAVVNERPPVTREQMEERWRVDCASAARDLYRLLDSPSAHVEAVLSLTEPIQLCAHLDRVEEREGKPFVILAEYLEKLTTCLEAGDGPCEQARQPLLSMLRNLDMNQGETP